MKATAVSRLKVAFIAALGVATLLGAAILVGGCVNGGFGIGPCHVNRTLTETESGGIVALRVGETIEIELQEPGATGYLWLTDNDGAPQLALVGRDTRGGDAGPNVAGASITRVLRFAAREAGETQLRLGLRRPWETAPPARTFVVTVRVNP